VQHRGPPSVQAPTPRPAQRPVAPLAPTLRVQLICRGRLPRPHAVPLWLHCLTPSNISFLYETTSPLDPISFSLCTPRNRSRPAPFNSLASFLCLKNRRRPHSPHLVRHPSRSTSRPELGGAASSQRGPRRAARTASAARSYRGPRRATQRGGQRGSLAQPRHGCSWPCAAAFATCPRQPRRGSPGVAFATCPRQPRRSLRGVAAASPSLVLYVVRAARRRLASPSAVVAR
jgi:hypothetical protein